VCKDRRGRINRSDRLKVSEAASWMTGRHHAHGSVELWIKRSGQCRIIAPSADESAVPRRGRAVRSIVVAVGSGDVWLL